MVALAMAMALWLWRPLAMAGHNWYNTFSSPAVDVLVSASALQT